MAFDEKSWDQKGKLCQAHLYESGCWVPPLLKVLLPVLLLNLQSEARAQNALKDRRRT